ncbi:MAG: hypothetical protein ACO3VG_06770 [Nitriliruptoraceae bacterium]
MSRWSRIADLLRQAAAGAPVAAAVAAVAAVLLGAERAGIALLTDGVPAGVVGTDAAATGRALVDVAAEAVLERR